MAEVIILLPINELDALYNEYAVNQDETRILFLKIIEQAIRDYINLKNSEVPIEIQYFQTADAFLFEKGYMIQWGDFEIDLETILHYLHLEPDWFMRRLKAICKKK